MQPRTIAIRRSSQRLAARSVSPMRCPASTFVNSPNRNFSPRVEIKPAVGVLALQGDVVEHVAALTRAGAHATAVKTPADLAGVGGLVIPGGESTTVMKLLDRFGLIEPIRA